MDHLVFEAEEVAKLLHRIEESRNSSDPFAILELIEGFWRKHPDEWAALRARHIVRGEYGQKRR